jgi:hypothetical protein
MKSQIFLNPMHPLADVKYLEKLGNDLYQAISYYYSGRAKKQPG